MAIIRHIHSTNVSTNIAMFCHGLESDTQYSVFLFTIFINYFYFRSNWWVLLSSRCASSIKTGKIGCPHSAIKVWKSHKISRDTLPNPTSLQDKFTYSSV